MSIYIKGLDMPESCIGCRLMLRSGQGCVCQPMRRYVRDLSNALRPRLAWCPLLPVPAHGRLIDADALEPDTEWEKYYDGFISYSQLAIDIVPTIIPADKEEKA